MVTKMTLEDFREEMLASVAEFAQHWYAQRSVRVNKDNWPLELSMEDWTEQFNSYMKVHGPVAQKKETLE